MLTHQGPIGTWEFRGAVTVGASRKWLVCEYKFFISLEIPDMFVWGGERTF